MTTNADGSPAQGATGESSQNGTPTIGETKPNEPSLPIAEKPTAPNPAEGPAPVIYESTNDPALDMALEFVGKFGIGPDDPAMVAAGDGNFSLLEAKLAAMGDKAKGFEKFIALGKSSYTGVQEKAKAEAAQRAADIYKVVGGEDQWKAIKEWAGKNAEPAEQEVVNTALQAGGMQAKAMAFYLSTLYDNAAGVNQAGKSAVVPNAGSGSPNAGTLSPRAYTKEVDSLARKLGSRMESSPEYRQLQARRQAWRK